MIFTVLVLFFGSGAFASENVFFSGYAKGCIQTKQYSDFQTSLCKEVTLKNGDQTCQKGTVLLPAGMSGKISRMDSKPGYTYFVVTLDAPVRYAGNTIFSIGQLSGHENGINTAELITDSGDLNDVKNKIKASGTVFKKSKPDPSGEASTFAQVFKGKDQKVAIVCDTSN